MRQTVLLGARHLGERATAVGHLEYRVVTEPLLAARRLDDAALEHAFADSLLPRRKVHDTHGAESRGAPDERDAVHLAQQLLHVVGIRGGGTGVARGVDTGPAAERIDFEPGVVR